MAFDMNPDSTANAGVRQRVAASLRSAKGAVGPARGLKLFGSDPLEQLVVAWEVDQIEFQSPLDEPR